MARRSPIVTILGHVDHGKTTLLDYIRHSNITSKEKGGITQKIGAYEIVVEKTEFTINKITFIDTPGHEIFSQLRAKGAMVADIGILLIDGRESIKPQTVESIAHLKSAKIPFIVAINKIDLPDVNPERVKDELLKYEVIVEEKGGKVPAVNISAKTGQGIKDLLETILLMSLELNLEYDENHPSYGYVIEMKKDKRGQVITVILKDGKIKVGDWLYCGKEKFNVRSIIDDKGRVKEILFPSTPAELLGLKNFASIGTKISTSPEEVKGEEDKVGENTFFSSFNISELLNKKREKKIKIILKADNINSLESIVPLIKKNSYLELVLSSIGEIVKSDVFLAKTTKAIIIGFNISVNQEVKQLAKEEKIPIKLYDIVYELIDDVNEITRLLTEKRNEKKYKGEAKILAIFNIDDQVICGIKMLKGKANLSDKVEIYRNNQYLGKGELVSIKKRAKAVNEVKKEEEAGMLIASPLDFMIGDVVKFIL